MHDLHAVSRLAEVVAHVLSDHHRSVLSPGATERDRQITLPFPDIVRQKVHQQLRDAIDELLRLGEGTDVLGYPRMPPGQRAELRHKMRIRQKPDVEDQVGILRYSMFETKAYARYEYVLVRCLMFELFRYMRAQLVHVELRRVDHEISNGPDRPQMFAFLLQRGFHWGLRAQWMGPASLAEAPKQGCVRRLKVHDLGGQHLFDGLQDVGQLIEFAAFPDVNDKSGPPDFGRLHGQFGKAGDQFDRKIIDTVVAQVLKGLER